MSDRSRDILIDLERAWLNPDSAERLRAIPETPRMRWHRKMRAAMQMASATERACLAIECRRVAELEAACLRSGGLPHLLGTDSDPRSARSAPAAAVGDSYDNPQTPPPPSTVDEAVLAQRLLANWHRRCGR